MIGKLITTLTSAALVAGCSSIGTVNGVPVGKQAQVSTQSGPDYCERNRAVCIVGGIFAVGAAIYLFDQMNNDSDPVILPRRRGKPSQTPT